eukprot:CAMPEP_0173429358 /NCGR_PEP_ID=MMETSP1357-20121228/8087_1 /TAXON_ID=77926 /ORGANISM="Hemiselmis rufescens, Strain PCC563" /LENGTH=369 /DNA_ID=CAMNT_0014393527 /DNA_START=32 /DNA_END=1137 /DNA_ORIENTATION=-
MRPSNRGAQIPSFKVMDVMRQAAAKEAALKEAGSSTRVLHLEVGQPSTGAPQKVKEAAAAAVHADKLGYTGALGTPELRSKVAAEYGKRYGVKVEADEVLMTTGSSGAFVVAFTALFDAGSRVAMATPGYPCYRNILQALGCEIVTIPTTAESNWQPTVAMLDRAAAGGKIDGLIVASPSNPTGTVILGPEMEELCGWCTSNGVAFVSDEIYHGLTLGRRPVTALAYKGDSVVINSFSKYHCMTGWRVGWMVVRDKALHPAMEALLQNLYISVPTLAQVAAVTALDCEEELDGHVARYRENLRVLLDGLPSAGFDRISRPDGAFYLYCDVTSLLRLTGARDSLALCSLLLAECAVAITSGLDFDPERGG